MKDTFKEIVDKELMTDMKLNRQALKSYFAKLWNAFKFKTMDPEVIGPFETCSIVSEECYEDIWYEIDINQTGYITWHQVKAFIKRVDVHEKELSVERERVAKILAEKEAER